MVNTLSLNNGKFAKCNQKNNSNVLDKIDKRYDNYLVRVKIEEFNKLFIKNLNNYFTENPIDNIKLADYVEMVGEFSDRISNYLFIDNDKDLQKCLSSIKSSELLLKDAVKNNNLEAILNSFSTLKTKINLLNVL